MGFDQLAGNPQIKHILRSYLRNRTVPPSMIFSGTDDCSKFAFARTFAQALNCVGAAGGDADACGRCKPCLDIDRNRFPDVQIMEAEGQQYKKEQIDELIAQATRKPIKAEKKVFILKGVQRLNENSANAFLKTLEEPSPANIFILITANLNLLLPTIRSRCQILKFRPLNQSEMLARLAETGMTPEETKLFNACFREQIEEVNAENWKELLSKRTAAFAVLNGLLTQTAVEDILLDLYDRSRDREAFLDYFRELINLLSLFLRDIMVLMIDRRQESIINFDYKDKLLHLLHLVTLDKIFFLLRKMELLLRDVRRNLNARVLILEFINSFASGEKDG